MSDDLVPVRLYVPVVRRHHVVALLQLRVVGQSSSQLTAVFFASKFFTSKLFFRRKG